MATIDEILCGFSDDSSTDEDLPPSNTVRFIDFSLDDSDHLLASGTNDNDKSQEYNNNNDNDSDGSTNNTTANEKEHDNNDDDSIDDDDDDLIDDDGQLTNTSFAPKLLKWKEIDHFEKIILLVAKAKQNM